MKKSILLLCSLLLLLQATWAQVTVVGSENFDGTSHTFSATTMNGATWTIDQSYYYNGTKSIGGAIPIFTGDSIVLTSPIYDFSLYGWVEMSFAHICKVSVLDECKVQYRLDAMGPMGAWKDIPATAYKGTGRNYGAVGFNANSYDIWNAADSNAMPVNSTWWQSELFDVTNEVSYDRAQFRFVLKRTATAATLVNYGWLIDAFQVRASTYEIKPPVVQLLNTYKDTVAYTGPYVVNAKVASRTAAKTVTPKLYWTAVQPNGMGTVNDSIAMTAYEGDSLWTAYIPQYVFGTSISYKVIGKDTTGNTDSAVSTGFISKRVFSNYIYVGDTTLTNTISTIPYESYYDYSWSRTLYLASELQLGPITHIAWRCNTNNVTTNNISVYFKQTTDVSISSSTSYINPITDGATLVWQGSITTVNGWVDITLNDAFYVQNGYGLIVYVDNNDGSWTNAIAWRSHAVSTALQPVFGRQDASMPSSGSVSSTRPHTRFYLNKTIDSTAMTLLQISGGDTVTVSPASATSISVDVLNSGYYNLTSAVLGWSVNGVVQSNNVPWSGNLYADYQDVCALGSYSPKMNGYDTVEVWVNSVNGKAVTQKDTLTKRIYGSADIVLAWQKYMEDTVYTTGPFEFEVSAHSLSGRTITAIGLAYTLKQNGTTIATGTLPLNNNGNNMWSIKVANLSYGTEVIYAAQATDYMGNVVSLGKTSYIDGTKTVGLVAIGDTTCSRSLSYIPSSSGINSSWSRMLYTASEVGGKTLFGVAWYSTNGPTAPVPGETLYARLVNYNTIADEGTTGHIDPLSVGATLVWQGSIPNLTSNGGWFECEFNTPIQVPNNMGVMLYYEHNTTSVSSSYFCGTVTGYTRSSGGDEARPATKFHMAVPRTWNANSVALEEIVSPEISVAPSSQPLKVIIRNKGSQNLNCTIAYSVNGGTPVTYNYTQGLACDFIDTVLLGNIAMTYGNVYHITVWVSDPNGQVDPVTSDDTLSVMSVPCSSQLAPGTFTIGPSANADFATLDQFIRIAQYCGISSHGTFRLEMETGTHNGQGNFAYLQRVFNNNDEIILTSQSGNASDVVLSNSDNVIVLGRNYNVYINNLTIATTTASAAGVYFDSACSNVEIKNCVFNMSNTASSATGSAIYFPGSTSNTGMGNLRILNNTFNDGYAGLWLTYANANYAGVANNPARITITNNKFNRFRYYGVYAYNYIGIDRIADNEFVSSTAGNTIYTINLGYTRIDSGVVRNKILLQNSSTGYGIRLYYAHNASTGTTVPALIANNEIRKLSGSGTFYGLYQNYAKANWYHNTVYHAGTGSSYGIYVNTTNTTYPASIRNNIFVSNSSSTTNYPIYGTVTNLNNCDLDYNCYWGPRAGTSTSYVGYAGAAKADLTAWRAALNGKDSNSVSLDPQFKNISQNGDINNYTALMCPTRGVDADINGNKRWSVSAMGAYTPIVGIQGTDLELVAMVEPDTSNTELCTPNYVTAKYTVKNVGTDMVDFSQTPMTLTLYVSGADSAVWDTVISTGSLMPFVVDTFVVTNMLNVDVNGILNFVGVVTCSADTIKTNDTVYSTFGPTRWMLPLDENFSNGFPESMQVRGNNTADSWTIMLDSNASGTVIPQFGNAMMTFEGNRGATSKLMTRQLNFSNIREPILEFWYWHDTSASVATGSLADFVNVAYTVNGGVSYVALERLQKNDGSGRMGWHRHMVSLDSAIGASCVIITFDATRLSLAQYDGAQYLDRIRVTAKQDVAVTDILTSPITVCNTTTDLSVVLENVSSQAIDFSVSPTALQVEITGAMTRSFTYPLTSGTLAALSKDTFDITTGLTFNNGNYHIAVKIATAIDNNDNNDTMSKDININPSLLVDAQKVSTSSSCLIPATPIYQVVNLNNNGDMDMSDLVFVLEVSNSTGSVVETLRDTMTGVLSAGASVSHTFAYPYSVPNDVQYNVAVTVAPMCNAAMTYQSVINECIESNDLSVDGIITPANDGTCNKVGDRLVVKVKVSNKNPNDDAQNVVVHAAITDNNGTQLAAWDETLGIIYADDYEELEFPMFIIPSVPSYTVSAYLVGNSDMVAANDTAAPVTKCTDLAIENATADNISMSQNIPNPAKGITSVNYTIPEDGKVMFNIMSVTGQVLYTEEVNAMSGNNRIEFNTASLASGIYFYTMTFNGQRIVKRMTIER